MHGREPVGALVVEVVDLTKKNLFDVFLYYIGKRSVTQRRL